MQIITRTRRLILPGATVLLFLFLFIFSISYVSSQETPPGTIRVHVTLVPVDVRVTDLKGKPILDLRKEDFSVFENGVRQDVQHFSMQNFSTMSAEPERKLLLRKIPRAELTPQTSRTLLILFGRGRYQKPFKAVDALIHFVRNSLLPQDNVAVFAYNRATDFTTDHEKIAQVLERYKKIHEKIESQLEDRAKGLSAEYGSSEMPNFIQPEIDTIFEGPEAVASRRVSPAPVPNANERSQDSQRASNLALTKELTQMAPKTTDLISGPPLQKTGGRLEPDSLKVMDMTERGNLSPLSELGSALHTDLPFERYVSENAKTKQDAQNIFTSIEYLRYLSGEKHLMFFTENGLFLPKVKDDRDIASVANDARVSIDSFQTGGLFMEGKSGGVYLASSEGVPFNADPSYSRPPSGSSIQMGISFASSWALSSLRGISQWTGGQSFIHSSIPGSLAQMNEVSRSDYLMGYYPKNSNWDGHYRRITVKVSRPGVRVSYRHGYYAGETLEPYDREAFLKYSRIASAGGYEYPIKDLSFKVNIEADRSDPNNPQAKVNLLIDPSKVGFAVEKGMHKGEVEIALFYGDPRGHSVESKWDTLHMNLSEETYQKVLKEGIPFATQIPLQWSGQTVKVVVYNYDNDRIGSLMTKVK
ncbi:MAG: VWA domain-containing protein [Acidobacteriia bacterium]|nr:VWA domain-containing protein [Terriglobia bacterium]